MGRPISPYELSDPDFSWLISNFEENNPQYRKFEYTGLPVVFIREEFVRSEPLHIPPQEETVTPSFDDDYADEI